MPIPPPSGAHRVGSVTHSIVDAGRPMHLGSEVSGRRLLVKIWYPAASATTAVEPLWAEVRRDPRTPLPMRLLLACLRGRTATVPNAPFSAAVEAFPLVIYNHGLISFAAENTSLMQELASHGYTVLAIQHADQLTELRALNAAQPADERRELQRLEQRLQAAAGRDRARRAAEWYERAVNTARIAIERSVDTSFVLDRAAEVLAKVPGIQPESVDTTGADAVGFSLGGAVGTVAAERDARVRSVVNLDGGLYGSRDARHIRVPYLMLYSERNGGMNDDLLPDHAERVTQPGTAHLNYHDAAALLPFLRLLRVTGRVNAADFLAERNRAVRNFLL